jgi:4-diphosphocytidyl-2-C-methyl-D-erythritol kinase
VDRSLDPIIWQRYSTALMIKERLSLPAHAKVNLSLRVLGKRADGFHEVLTRMCPVSLADEVSVQAEAGGTSRLTCSDTTIPTDESNLAVKALRAFEKASGVTSGWHIHLEKRIPHGAGLGGGSSDAAAVLRALNRLSGEVLTPAQLHEIAASLGSDVPFFLHGTVCDASGRGEVLAPVADFPWRLPLVLIKPPFGIATPWAYQRWSASREMKGVNYAPQECPWGAMVNDLERPVFQKWLMLPALKSWLLEQTESRAALMSGSGSTVFAVCHTEEGASSLAQKAREFCGETSQVFVCSSVGVKSGHRE